LPRSKQSSNYYRRGTIIIVLYNLNKGYYKNLSIHGWLGMVKPERLSALSVMYSRYWLTMTNTAILEDSGLDLLPQPNKVVKLYKTG